MHRVLTTLLLIAGLHSQVIAKQPEVYFSFKGYYVESPDSYLFSILDTTSNSAAWVRPLEDINGFSITAFDPQQRAIRFQWKGKTGTLFLGNSSSSPHTFSPQVTLSQAKIVFSETQINKGDTTTKPNTAQKYFSSSSANKSFASGKKITPVLSREAIIAAAASEDRSVYPAALRNNIKPNRVNSRIHASDHIRDLQNASLQ